MQTGTSVALAQSGAAQGGAGGAGGAGSAVTTTGVPVGGTPLPNTAAELRNLIARRNEISNQLTNVSSRREDLAGELRNAAPGADRVGLENRIGVLDNRLKELETQLDVTGKQVIAARGIIAVDPDPPVPPGQILSSGQITAISLALIFAVAMPLAMAWARAVLRRSKAQSEAPSRQLTDRLDRMEEGIEAIAIEMERVSEGQRFVTKVLGAGAAQPVSVEQKEKIALER
jgi:hypothetical protein